MLKGRLGLATARIPHTDRHGLVHLERGKLYVEDGTLCFATAGTDTLNAGVYQIPYQTVSNVLLGPGSTISHDAMRLLASHGTGLLIVGSGGVRFYAASMPAGADRSELARRQTELWADPEQRIAVARKMFAIRLGEVQPTDDLDTLRGIEGHRMKELYRQMARQYGVQWQGRRYDRTHPESDDLVNTAINHASAAVRAAAMIAVAATATIPQLGFIHEASGEAFVLDIADLFRDSVTLPVAFQAASRHQRHAWEDIERLTRTLAGSRMRSGNVIARMIQTIGDLLHAHDHSSDA